MVKSPLAGYSKTRLCPPLRPEQAARLSAAFLRDTTETMRAAAASVPVAGYAAYAPAGTEEALIPHLAAGTSLILADGSVPAPAGVEGFGRCLLHAVQTLFDRGHSAACVLSADTPTLPTAILVTAATLLLTGSDSRAVVGACDDGGYYLLGMRRPHARLFADITWSTDTVAAQTRDRAAALGLDLFELPLWYDIDDDASLDRLVQETSGSNNAPWTRHAIGALGLSVPMRSPGTA
ncbi:TIGR04282 family arsenosugar biosynthesis glycosyltransferase [Bradyrhizobium sp.]|uniref:TIGR04282 family arsenosugar biosynthesis glycosyltransferase n=1 Tax=Bradyrhizobium sp. TaxID=376 RepID=UPI002BD63A5D|nr:TIGR04282 family arsenosugar biosynthesis glycosyltransferase [Bradyrhizobium sp.]HWX63780.1 TIGR04282 family arsenosugar biosynthesis glycosyltransferase [Bradyrhizobium sp.]